MSSAENYKLIASNTISYFIRLADLYGSKYNFKQLLFLAGITDTVYYLSEGKFSEADIALAVGSSQAGLLSLGNHHRSLSIPDLVTQEEHLIYFIMQLECLIIQADLAYPPEFILDRVIENKHRTLEGMNDAFSRSNSILLDGGIEKAVRGIVSIYEQFGYWLKLWNDGQTFEQEAQSIAGRYNSSQGNDHPQSGDSKSVNQSAEATNNSKGSSLFAAVFGILACFALLFVLFYPEINRSGKAEAAIEATPEPTPITYYRSVNPVAFPANGQSYVHNGQEREAPFIIHLPEDSNYYYIVLADNTTGRMAVSIYGYSGSTLEIQVPLGEYSLFYCCGDVWYGKNVKFGEAGSYFKASETLDFHTADDYVYYHEVTLYPTYNGNMESIDVDADDFPV